MVILQGVSKHYPERSRPALDNISLHVSPGQFLFLTGPSGAGKTTFLRLLFGASFPSAGSVKVGGADLGRLKPRQIPRLRRKLGVIFQDFKLMPRWSVFENVALALRVDGVKGADLVDRVERSLAQVGLEQVAGARADSLSGGEQQRAAIARALVHEPALVLADEPSGNLDPGNALEVLKLLVAAHARGATVILATHDPKLLKLVRGARVVRLEAGHLEEF